MRRNVSRPLVAASLLLVALLALSCAPAAPATQQMAKPVELRLANFLPATHVITVGVVNKFADEVKKASAGRMNITVYSGEALGKAGGYYDMVRTGAVDMAVMPPSYNPGTFPLSDIVSLPFAFQKSSEGSRAAWELNRKGYFDKEFGAVKMVGLWVAAPYAMFTTKKKVTSLQDLKGLMVRVSGSLEGPAVQALGAVPVTVPYGEMYLALERGVADVGTTSMSGATAIKLQEIAKYALDVGYSTIMLTLFMNKDAFQKLPKDLQKVINDQGALLHKWGGETYDKGEEDSKALFRKAGAEVYTLAPAEKEKWQKAVKPTWDAWVNDMEKKGLGGKKVSKDFFSLLEKEGVKLPS